MKKKLPKPAKKKQVEKKIPPAKPTHIDLSKVGFSRLDYKRIRRLLLMGIALSIKQKKSKRYKVWVKGFPHLLTLARSPVSAYRRIFKILREKGVYIP